MLFLPRYIKKHSLIIPLFLFLFSQSEVSALGLFEDVSERAMNLTAPMKASLQSSFLRAEHGEQDASAFFLAFSRPLRKRFLLSFELSYVVLNDPEEMHSNLGDLIASLRTEIYRKGGLLILLAASFRTGSGSREIYPYASGSMDIRVGLGMVDSLSLFTIWSEATFTSVHRASKSLPQNERHDDFGTLNVGLILPIRDDLSISFGAEGYHLLAGGTRELYSGGVVYAHSSEISLFAILQAEGGALKERACDRHLRIGVKVYH